LPQPLTIVAKVSEAIFEQPFNIVACELLAVLQLPLPINVNPEDAVFEKPFTILE
jgi:hypothetical protein